VEDYCGPTCCDLAADGAADEDVVLPMLSVDADDLSKSRSASFSCSCPDLLLKPAVDLLLAAHGPPGSLWAAVLCTQRGLPSLCILLCGARLSGLGSCTVLTAAATCCMLVEGAAVSIGPLLVCCLWLLSVRGTAVCGVADAAPFLPG
jgi:hypothetical protein